MGDEQLVTADGADKDPEEQETLARTIGEDLVEACVGYVRGELDFAELTFFAYETLHDLHTVASGEYELEYDEGDADQEAGLAAGYDEDAATEQQEDLGQEPARG